MTTKKERITEEKINKECMKLKGSPTKVLMQIFARDIINPKNVEQLRAIAILFGERDVAINQVTVTLQYTDKGEKKVITFNASDGEE